VAVPSLAIEDSLPLLDVILDAWKVELGDDFSAYRNHCYRVANFCFALAPCDPQQQEKIAIAVGFHDLGIWADQTVDYLQPSIHHAKGYLEQQGQEDWLAEIALIINFHHKVLPYTNPDYPLVELFRQADLVDVSLGMVPFGLHKDRVRAIREHFPNAGFHQRLGELTWLRMKERPLSPLPMLKW